MKNPAENLLNLVLLGGWEVYEKVKKGPHGSGGNFSICYKVRRGKEEAFLKALDISRAFRMPDPVKWLAFLTNAHNYEVALLGHCATRNMDKVITAIDSGQIIPTIDNPAGLPVPYIVFEHAETTTREHVMGLVNELDNASLMRSLHDVAVGLSQLHGGGVAHQDLKGSNVLLMSKKGSSKISDLGRAELLGSPSQYFSDVVAGDPAYAPPELLYGDARPDWDVRRKATDLYQLGSLICFYYTKDSMTGLLKTFLPTGFCWTNWKGNYNIVLPYLQSAFEEAIDYVSQCLEGVFSDEKTRNSMLDMVRFLCDPEPTKRGHPADGMFSGSRYSLIRFITVFDVLANSFEAKMI